MVYKISKPERLMNLVICLMTSKQFLTAEKIRQIVDGYKDKQDDEAFQRMFERDKNELRQLGIPIETGSTYGSFESNGYRINSNEYAMTITVTKAEAAVISLVSAFWKTSQIQEITTNAFSKLRSAGIEINDKVPDGDIENILAQTEVGNAENISKIMEAIFAKKSIKFLYKDSAGNISEKTIEPAFLFTKNNHWYITGVDCEKIELRTLRINRIKGDLTLKSSQGFISNFSNEIEKIRSNIRSGSDPFFENETKNDIAKIWIESGYGSGLKRRFKVNLSSNDHYSINDSDGSLIEIKNYIEEELVNELTSLHVHSLVLEPTSLKEKVISNLKKLTRGFDE